MKHTKVLLLLLSSIPLFAQVQPGAIDTVAGNGTYGFSGDGGAATKAQIDAVYGLAVDSQRAVYIADTWNHRIRKVTVDGTITTVAGTGQAGYSGDNGAATAAKLSYPRGLATDLQGALYISDSGNSCVRKVGPDGIITTIAGTGVGGYSGDGGPAKAAQLWYPRGIALDAAGNIYIADSMNFRVRKVTIAGIISTIAGTGVNGFSGEGGQATQAQLGVVHGLAVDFRGNLFFTDISNHNVRKVAPDGVITTVAGGDYGFAGDGGAATSAQFRYPRGLAVDVSGNLFVADCYNHRVRRIAPDGTIMTVAGTGTEGYSGDGGPPASAQLDAPYDLAFDPGGAILIADLRNYRVRRAGLMAGGTGTPAEMISPPNASTFSSSTVTFQWTAGSGVDQYYLAISSHAAGNELGNLDQGTRLSTTVSGLPADGRKIYVRLLSRFGQYWLYNDYVYTAASSAGTPAAMISPPNGSTFSSSTVTFQWTAGSGADQYYLAISSHAAGNELGNLDQGTHLSTTVSGLPADGRKIYVRLLSRFGQNWLYNDYVYTAAGGTGTPAEMISPANGSTFSSSTVTFQWTAGSGVDQYYLAISSHAAGNELGNLDQGARLSTTVTGLPADGRKIYVRLLSRFGQNWLYNDYVYTAAGGTGTPAEMISPANGSTFSSSTVTFQWTAGSGVDQYYLAISSHAAGNELGNLDQGTRLSTTVSGLPADGRKIYVRLLSRFGQNWLYNDYVYTAAGGAPTPAAMISPANGSTFSSSTVTFQWTAGSGADQYYLAISSHAAGNELGNLDQGTRLSTTVSGLPADGRKIYVRLLSRFGQNWLYNDYVYTAAGGAGLL